MTQDLLSDDNTDPVIDPTKDYLEELVGDGKKFTDVKALAKGKYESDLLIETMKRRQDELRDDYMKLRNEHMASKGQSDLMDQINQIRQQQSNNTNQPPVNTDNKAAIDPSQLKSLVSEEVRSIAANEKADANFKLVETKLQEQLGNNYKSVLKAKADSLGLSPEDVNALARKSPNAFFNTFGFNETQARDTFQAPPSNARRSDNFSPTTQKKTWTYYQDMKAKNPAQYHNPKTQVQMHNDYLALGQAFEDGDFHRSF